MKRDKVGKEKSINLGGSVDIRNANLCALNNCSRENISVLLNKQNKMKNDPLQVLQCL